jgi:Ni/Fe-hydrogenase subunit HybB-like protein
VLSLEFAPILLSKWGLEAPCRWIHAVSLPLMILGVLLSTLHQSSFGSLYLIVPTRLHPLWYSPLLPVLFFISCIASGISMILIETLVLARSRGTILAPELRANLAKIVALALAVYLVVRFQDLLGRGMLPEMLKLSYYSLAFYTEIVLGCLAPLALLLSERVRLSTRGLYLACLLVLGGFAANRMNTAITGMERWPTQTYFPSVMEILIMLGIAATGFTVFTFVANHLPIFQSPPESPGLQEDLGTPRPYSV